MSQDSIINSRLWKWFQACSAWGFENIESPFQEKALAALPAGVLDFRARRTAVIGGDEVTITLDVSEAWLDGDDPIGDRRLNAEGCHIGALEWHAQVGEHSGEEGAERLEVIPEEDEKHPRIHRHPYGEPDDDVRPHGNLAEPAGWLSALNALLDNALDEGLQDWDSLDEEQE